MILTGVAGKMVICQAIATGVTMVSKMLHYNNKCHRYRQARQQLVTKKLFFMST